MNITYYLDLKNISFEVAKPVLLKIKDKYKASRGFMDCLKDNTGIAYRDYLAGMGSSIIYIHDDNSFVNWGQDPSTWADRKLVELRIEDFLNKIEIGSFDS
jgi:hypothetical protein